MSKSTSLALRLRGAGPAAAPAAVAVVQYYRHPHSLHTQRGLHSCIVPSTLPLPFPPTFPYLLDPTLPCGPPPPPARHSPPPPPPPPLPRNTLYPPFPQPPAPSFPLFPPPAHVAQPLALYSAAPGEGEWPAKGLWRTEPRRLKLRSGAYGIPKKCPGEAVRAVGKEDGDLRLAVQVGEDAYFVRPDALGIADGVGGWANRPNANAALFSRRLMAYSALALAEPPPARPPDAEGEGEGGVWDEAVEVLQRAYERCIAEAKAEAQPGSSTALLALLRENELLIAHLGDCAISVIRHGALIFRSTEQTHSFNFPFQLGTNSPLTPRSSCLSYRVPVEPGDVVVMSSDGLTDNLWDDEVLEEVGRFAPPDPGGAGGPMGQWGVERVSEALCSRARRVAEDGAGDEDTIGACPFSARAAEAGVEYPGGKMDDISVLVAVIAGDEHASSPP